jgi:hypothetical protein
LHQIAVCWAAAHRETGIGRIRLANPAPNPSDLALRRAVEPATDVIGELVFGHDIGNPILVTAGSLSNYLSYRSLALADPRPHQHSGTLAPDASFRIAISEPGLGLTPYGISYLQQSW